MALNNIINLNSSNPLSAATGGTGLASPTAHGILVAEGASAANPIVLTNGQLLIGSTGNDPVAAALTAGAGISVTNGAGSSTIACTVSPAGTTVEVTGTSQTASVLNNYIANNAALVTITLPAAPANIGDFVWVWGKGAGGWRVAAGSGSQVLRMGNVASAAGGTCSSTGQWDCAQFRVITAGASAVWSIVSAGGTLDIV